VCVRACLCVCRRDVKLSKNGYISAVVVEEVAEAEGLLEAEIKEVQAEAERLRPGWGRGVYAQAYDIIRRQRAQVEAEEEEARARGKAGAAAPTPVAAAAAAKPAASALSTASAAGDISTAPALSWSQTVEEVEVAIAVPPGTRPKDVSVQFGTQSCVVRIGGKEAKPVLSGTLLFKVTADECTWSLMGEGGARKLQVTLFKREAGDWTQLLASA